MHSAKTLDHVYCVRISIITNENLYEGTVHTCCTSYIVIVHVYHNIIYKGVWEVLVQTHYLCVVRINTQFNREIVLKSHHIAAKSCLRLCISARVSSSVCH